MEMPLPELLDRLAIVRLKAERIKDKEKEKELKFYIKELENYKKKGFIIKDEWLESLYDINGKIWDLEADIRKGKEGELGLSEVGKRAIEIRNLNKTRISIKNEITEVTGSGFKDIKINHASE
jgi:uncharacterized protein YdcH (DUF465 family)